MSSSVILYYGYLRLWYQWPDVFASNRSFLLHKVEDRACGTGSGSSSMLIVNTRASISPNPQKYDENSELSTNQQQPKHAWAHWLVSPSLLRYASVPRPPHAKAALLGFQIM